MNFCSDNASGAHPKVLEALAAANAGSRMPYGNDDLTRAVERKFADLFEHDCAVFLVGTGTAANALALSALVPPYGAVFCHPGAHINQDECGAPEFFTGGAKLLTIDGPHGRIAVPALEAAIAASGIGVVHHAQAAAISLTQATEAGTVYRAEEMGALAEVGRRHCLAMHVDGARFANALISLRCSPADLTWRIGVDVLSFGASKNGTLAAEAIVFFDHAKAASLGFRRKRAGHLWSKMRFLAAQMDAYLSDELWLANARHANQQATALAKGLAAVPGAKIEHPVEANAVFVTLPERVIAGLEADGFGFYRWLGPGTQLLRLVTAFDTAAEAVDGLVKRARHHAAGLRTS